MEYLTVDELKPLAIESIKDSTAMYFSCNVAKFLNRENGTLDIENFDYEALLGVNFGMDKRERIATDKWMDEYLFRVVINKNTSPKNNLKCSNRNPSCFPHAITSLPTSNNQAILYQPTTTRRCPTHPRVCFFPNPLVFQKFICIFA